MSTTAPSGNKPPGTAHHRRSSDTLAISWLHGAVSACVIRKGSLAGVWTAVGVAQTLAEFSTVVDEAMQCLGFDGTDICLVLAHSDFTLQPETVPALADRAARQFLQARLERLNQGKEAGLSISQPLYSSKKELSFLVHQLPAGFFREINEMFLGKKLELTRILPAVLPLQVLVGAIDLPKDKAAVVVAECGRSIALLIFKGDGQLLLARNMVAQWRTESERIAAEANRSALYSKQQFGTVVETVILLGSDNPDLVAHTQARCAKGVTVTYRHLSAADIPSAVAKIPVHHPVNLLAAFLAQRRTFQIVRRSLVAACWLGVILAALAVWKQKADWNYTLERYKMLQAGEASLRAEKETLTVRNAAIERNQFLVRHLIDEKLPPAPVSLLVHLAGSLPKEMEFTDFSARLEPGTLKGTFRVEGQVHADEEAAQEIMAGWVKTLSQSPFKIRINEAARALVSAPVAADAPPLQRFAIEGGYLDE